MIFFGARKQRGKKKEKKKRGGGAVKGAKRELKPKVGSNFPIPFFIEGGRWHVIFFNF